MFKRLLLAACCAAIAPCQTPNPIEKECRDILDRGLKDKNPDTRKQATIALSLVGAAATLPMELESMLDDKDVEVRLAAIASLIDLKNERTAPALHKALNDDVPEVSYAAARALWALGDADGKKALLSVLSGETRSSSGFFAKQKRDAMRMMHTPKTMFLFALKQGAGLAPVPGLGAGVSSMQALLSDPGVSGRATAALLLGKEKDEQTLQALREGLSDKDWSVRAACVHSLVLRDDPALQMDIRPLLEDKSEPVRMRAAAGYLRLETIKNKPKPPPAKPPARRPARKAAPAKKS